MPEADYEPAVATELAALVLSQLPIHIPDADPSSRGDWDVVGPAMLVRASTATQALFKLTPKDSWLAAEAIGRTVVAYAVCRSDMMIKGQEASHIVLGNSFSEDGHEGQTGGAGAGARRGREDGLRPFAGHVAASVRGLPVARADGRVPGMTAATSLATVMPGRQAIKAITEAIRTCSERLDARPLRWDQSRSKRSRFITLSHAATKSCTNLCSASSLA